MSDPERPDIEWIERTLEYGSMEDLTSTALQVALSQLVRWTKQVEEERQRLTDQINAAGGFHERTGREIECEAALEEIPVHERDPADIAIAELLVTLDGGRNRLWKVEELLRECRGYVESDSLIADIDTILRRPTVDPI